MALVWFSAIALIFCNSLRGGDSLDARLLRLAMAVTVIADFHMLITENYLYGVTAFCGVQAIYCLRYGGLSLCIWLILVWIALFNILAPHLELLIIFASLYAIGFILSLNAAISTAKKKLPYPQNLFVLWGMGLFACCDIFVAVNYLFPGSTYPLMWIFYLPSQALLSLSGARPSKPKGISYHRNRT